MILLIDNYDSFTFNLYQYLGELGEQIKVIRNDQVTIEQIEVMQPEAIVLSPGPGRPENAGICVSVIQSLYNKIPILGICLGHQAIGYAFGATIKKANNIMHGKVSMLTHCGNDVFSYLSQPLEAMRYHSLVIEPSTLPTELVTLAKSMGVGEIMAIKHTKYPLYGLQFHPESIGTGQGKQILKNFLQEVRKEQKTHEDVSTKAI